MAEQPTNYFVRNIKHILKEHGPVVSTFLAFLIDQDEFRKNTRKNYNGEFYVSRGMIAEETMIKRKAQISSEKILEDAGYISIVPGDHSANKYTINYERIDDTNPAKQVKEVPPAEDQVLTQVEGTSLPEEAPAPDSSLGGDQTEEGVNYIYYPKSLTKTVSKSADTYVPDGTESIHTALNVNDLCIKEISEQQPPASTNDEEIYAIINQYNEAMGGYEIADGDYKAVRDNLDDFRQLKPYFTPMGLLFAWKNFPDDGARKKLTKPRISTIISFKLMKTFLARKEEISSYCIDVMDMKLDKVFKYYRSYLNTIDPPKYQVNIVGGLCMNGSPESLYGKWHREERYKLYKEYLEPKLLHDEDIYDMIIDMEV